MIESVLKNDKMNIMCCSFKFYCSKSISTLKFDFSDLDLSLIGKNFSLMMLYEIMACIYDFANDL